MTTLPPDVEARAKEAALSSWMSNPGIHAFKGLVDFYLSCYTVERPRIELAALEEIRAQYPDELMAPHARIAQLKEEIEETK